MTPIPKMTCQHETITPHVAFILSQRSAFWVHAFTQNAFRKLKFQLCVVGLLPWSLAAVAKNRNRQGNFFASAIYCITNAIYYIASAIY